METQLIFEVIALSGISSLAAVNFLGKRLIEHRLSKDLKKYEADIEKEMVGHKASLDAALNASKAAHEAALKRDLEVFLGEKGSERLYVQEARRKLYVAVGPLRFQLLQASVEFSNRIEGIVRGNSYEFSMDAYFGRSTAYRILRVLGLCELIDRQVAIADFSVDPEIRQLLTFKRQIQTCLCSEKITLKHPHEKWDRQIEHLFRDTTTTLGSLMIVAEPGLGYRVKRYEEFLSDLADSVVALRYRPLLSLLEAFTPVSKPLVWLRLLSLAQASQALVARQGAPLELTAEPIDLDVALSQASDTTIQGRRDDYLNMLRRCGPVHLSGATH
jgi:hypothetical protein